MLQRIADSIILCPSQGEIRVEHKTQRTLAHDDGEIDVWVQRRHCSDARGPELFVLKFGGAGSRAERATMHPLDFWDGMSAEIWAPNWRGFGGSAGRASVQSLVSVGLQCYEEIRRAADGRPVLLTGNSLGTAVALAVAAAHRDMAGLLLRNPPPLRQLIIGKHGWYSLGIGAWLISKCVPASLDSIAKARGSDVPAMFVTSGQDRVVPPNFQAMVYNAYAGPKRQLVLPQAGHEDVPKEREVARYREHLSWLRSAVG